MKGFYKNTPYKVGEPRNVEPTLYLTVETHDEDRKHIHVKTRGGVKLVLAYDGKACCFRLHKFTPTGKIGGKVYNNWELNSGYDSANKAMERWQ